MKIHRPFCFAPLFTLAVAASATANDGFTEPFRTIQVAAPETGIIRDTLVEEGDAVDAGQALVQLDVDMQQAMLAIAAAGKEARGRVDASRAEVTLRKQMLTAFEDLHASGHARNEELERARTDLAIAEGQLASALEQQQLKQLEFERIQVQIGRRTVRAPLDGVVMKILKHAGEFTAPNDPNLIVLVQLDPLVATFDLPSDEASRLSPGDTVQIQFTDTENVADAEVVNVSPVINAESGTVAVRVQIPNSDDRFQSGQACVLQSP